MDDNTSFKTPSRVPFKSKLRDGKFIENLVSPVTIPPSPMMQKLGCGTGVVVYRLDRSLQESKSPWAVKKAKKSKEEAMRRLIKEGAILSKLKHPNIVSFRKLTQLENGDACLSMEEGGVDLGSMIENNSEADNQFKAFEVASVTFGIAKALSYLHNDHNILHGDIKSGNILISESFQKVKLCDFGVSLILKDDLSGPLDEDACYIGSQPWCSKEVLDDGPITDKADIFSYGLVIWEMLALESPHVCHITDENEDLDGTYCSTSESLSNEDSYLNALGTRPPLPDTKFDAAFIPIIGVFACCTEEHYKKRPSARQIVQAFEPTARQLNVNL